MWQGQWRERAWSGIADEGVPWDLVVVGGGIAGAGIARLAAALGLRVLLVEQRDFAWGASSRSSQLVHGGMRYLQHGNIRLVREALRERERLLAEAPGLVEPINFAYALRRREWPPRWVYRAALRLYDRLAPRRTGRVYDAPTLLELVPRVDATGFAGGIGYGEAQTDDARLVLRTLAAAVRAGAVALNYTAAEELLWEHGRVAGVRLYDAVSRRTAAVRARVVVNATGAWADRLRGQAGGAPRVRPLRGSHLVFPAWRLPVAQAVGFTHPADHRHVFVAPWQGVTILGTTDVDHTWPLDEEPHVAPSETAYLMAAATAAFPALGLTAQDVRSTWSGVRSVIARGGDPSRETRDHVVWDERGLLTVTGGKLTTFRVMARDALRAARAACPEWRLPPTRLDGWPLAAPAPPLRGAREALPDLVDRRLLARYGDRAAGVRESAHAVELGPISGTDYLWAELRWAARSEAVVHLDDLLLRRTRLGLLLPSGGDALLRQVRAICAAELGWDDARWEAEAARYLAGWAAAHSLPRHQESVAGG